MAYDDDGSIWSWRDIDDLVTLLERNQGVLDMAKLTALVTATHASFGGQAVQDVPVQALAEALQNGGLGSLPFETVTRVLELVSGVEADADPLERITLKDAQRIIRR